MTFTVTDITRCSNEVLTFWFDDIGAARWFVSSAELDGIINKRFGKLYRHLADHPEAHARWLERADASLALILVLDQFPRNIFRGQAAAFKTDEAALRVSKTALAQGHDLATPPSRRIFFYLPFEHSEQLADQEEAVRLVTERANLANYLEYAEVHRDIIRKFGRFPHRNEILGRTSTAAEIAYLADGGHRFGTKAATKDNA